MMRTTTGGRSTNSSDSEVTIFNEGVRLSALSASWRARGFNFHNPPSRSSIIVSIQRLVLSHMTHHKSFMTISSRSSRSVLRFLQPSFHPYTQIHLVIHGICNSVTGFGHHCSCSFLFYSSYCYSSYYFLISHLILTISFFVVVYLDHLLHDQKSSRFLSGRTCFFRRVSTSWSSSGSWFCMVLNNWLLYKCFHF